MKFNALIPELSVSNFQHSRRFYVELLGFHVEYDRDQPPFAFLSFGESQLMLEQDYPEQPPAWRVEPIELPRGRGLNLSIRCGDAHALAERLRAAGVPLRLPPEDRWYRCGALTLGERHFLVQDPDGYLLRFEQALGERGTEPG